MIEVLFSGAGYDNVHVVDYWGFYTQDISYSQPSFTQTQARVSTIFGPRKVAF